MNGKQLLMMGVFLGIFLVSLFMFIYGYDNTWKIWNIPTMHPCFADFRGILAGLESQSLGLDPLVNNPKDPWQRAVNYPRIWLMLLSGFNQAHTVYFGITLTFLFLVGVFFYLPSRIHQYTAFILMICIFSPAVLLGVERSNTDLLIFFLFCVAIRTISKDYVLLKIIAAVAILAAIILKLFPIFGISLLLNQTKRVVIRFGFLILVCTVIYSIVIFNDLSLIYQGTPKSTWFSFGMNVLWMKIGASSVFWGGIVKILSNVMVLIYLGIVVYWILSKNFAIIDSAEYDKRSIDSFRVGSSIYIGVFLLGNNFEYRLIFLLFVIPQLMLWSKSSMKHLSIISSILVVGIILSMWDMFNVRLFSKFTFGHEIIFYLNIFLHWVIFMGLLYLFTLSLPLWIKNDAQRMFSKN